MQIIFTRNSSPVSKWIRAITSEPVSHCAIRVGEFVIQSNLLGVNIVPFRVFARTNKIVYTTFVSTVEGRISRILDLYYGSFYDFGALLFLFLRYTLPGYTPKQNLWRASGMFLCTEFVTKVIDDTEDSLITPYKLYKKLAE